MDELTMNVEFKTSRDRSVCMERFRKYFAQQIAIAKITADVEAEKDMERLRRQIQMLEERLRSDRERLQRYSEALEERLRETYLRWCSDLIDAALRDTRTGLAESGEPTLLQGED